MKPNESTSLLNRPNYGTRRYDAAEQLLIELLF